MKYLLLLALFSVGCGQSQVEFHAKESQSCKVTKKAFGSLIECPDGTSSFISNGLDAGSCTASSVPPSLVAPYGGSLITCPNSTTSLVQNGTTGLQGVPGVNGSSCSVTAVSSPVAAPNGGSLLSCTDGTSALVLNGAKGATGNTGSQGTPGVAGTLVKPIQFCPGTSSYSSKFVEYGFLIDDKIYAVYSLNDGFLTWIPPGAYYSNGINSSCNFTVNTNGTITVN
jgi:hypothetical protein